MKNIPNDGWRIKRDSYSVMLVWFLDGNQRTFYSLDWQHPRSRIYDPEKGFQRFRRLIDKYGTKAGYIIISKNDDLLPRNRTILEIFYQGRPIELSSEMLEKARQSLSDRHY